MSRRFTGQILDAESGLYYYNARYCYEVLNWAGSIQPDTEISDLSDPQSYNRYSYVLNDPLRYNDPTGHGSDGDDDDPTEHLSLTLGSNEAMLRQQQDAASAQLYNQAGNDMKTVATVGRTVAEMNPVVGTADGVIGAATGKDAITQEPLTDGERVLAGVGGVTSIIPGEGAEIQAGGQLVRFGKEAETAESLAKDAAKAESKGFPHGVSTKLVDRISGTDKLHKSAPKSEVEKVFDVKQTGNNPSHHTVILPKPVTQETADKFNALFKQKSGQ